MSDYRRHVGLRVLVQLPAITIDGTLVADGKETLILEHASVVADSGDSRPIDGTVVVPQDRITWLQVP